jgi:hypothetical protein
LIRDGRIQRIIPAAENTDALLTRRKSRCKPCRHNSNHPSCNYPNGKKIWEHCRWRGEFELIDLRQSCKAERE